MTIEGGTMSCDSRVQHNVSTARVSRIRHNVSKAYNIQERHNVIMSCDSNMTMNMVQYEYTM